MLWKISNKRRAFWSGRKASLTNWCWGEKLNKSDVKQKSYGIFPESRCSNTGALYANMAFSAKKVNAFPCKMQVRQQTTESDKLKWTSFAQCCPYELRDDLDFLKRILFPSRANFHFHKLWINKIVDYGVQSDSNKAPNAVEHSLQL